MKKEKFGTRLLAGIMSAIMIAGLLPASSLADVQDVRKEAAATYDYYVDAWNGNDENDGTSEKTAFRTVKKAAEIAASGETIKLGDGKYTLYGISSTGTTKGKDLTFVGNGAEKTGWNIGAEVPDPANFGTEYNGDYSFDGAGIVTFKDMTLQASTKDYLGFIRADNTVVEDCTINGKTFYWGYETAEFKNTIFNCPQGDYAIWTYSSPVMTFDGCTFNASGKVINVYTDYSAGKHDITVNFKDCTVNSSKKSKSALNINDSNMGDYKYYVNISGKNAVNGLGTDAYTCSKIFAYGGVLKHNSNNKGKSVITIDGTPVWKDGKMVTHEIDTENDKYTDGYKDNAYRTIYGKWESQDDGSYKRTVTVKCNYCGWIKSKTEEIKPAKPTEKDIQNIDVVVKCVNEERSHALVSKAYPVTDHYRVGDITEENGTYVSEVTIEGWYYADKFNEDCEVKHPVTVNEPTFKMVWDAEQNEWKAPAATAIDPIEVDCFVEPQIPEKPEQGDFSDIDVVVKCVNEKRSHELVSKAYPVTDHYKIGDVTEEDGTYVSEVTIEGWHYADKFNEDCGIVHPVTVNEPTFKMVWDAEQNAWKAPAATTIDPIEVACDDSEEPQNPEFPTRDELNDLIGEVVLIHTGSNAEHQNAEYELIEGSYDIASASNARAVVTVKAAAYKDAYNAENGTHTILGKTSVKLILAHNDNGWFVEKGALPVTFTVKCTEKKPDTPEEPDIPEKRYTDIKFIVVNGTFTENGGTEITKTFEVGTKLTIADIPASKGKNSNYSDQTWDKYPLGYVVKEEGTTFTITYLWRSNGGSGSDSDSDSDGGSGSSSTRGKATNAAGKSGRWILEGGEFTEDNGRLPSNEYLKIGDTIYGFYTYGFAIDFDRPEYYTDAAIQAKGGYRDATGTWRLNGWWFCYDDGTFPHNEWVYLTWNGHSDWYYFDVDGWMEDGWLYQNNNWYYLHTKYDNTRGHMYTGWHEIDGKWYYFNTASDKGTLGAMLANTTTPDGYQVGTDGAWIQ